MKINNTGVIIETGYLDFSAGSAIGTYNTGVNIPPNAWITEFGFMTPVILADGGLGAGISFDLINTSGSVVYPAVILAQYYLNTNITVTPVAAYPLLTLGWIPVISPASATLSSQKTLAATAIGFSVSTHGLTSGTIQFYVKYIATEF